jgi:hypothetical protein
MSLRKVDIVLTMLMAVVILVLYKTYTGSGDWSYIKDFVYTYFVSMLSLSMTLLFIAVYTHIDLSLLDEMLLDNGWRLKMLEDLESIRSDFSKTEKKSLKQQEEHCEKMNDLIKAVNSIRSEIIKLKVYEKSEISLNLDETMKKLSGFD